MKAYDMCMLLVFINAAVLIVMGIGFFGEELTDSTIFWSRISFLVEGQNVGTLASALAVASTVGVLIFRGQTSSAWATATFSAVFWMSFVPAFDLIYAIPLPGMGVFASIWMIAAVMSFIFTLIQMPQGGQKSYD